MGKVAITRLEEVIGQAMLLLHDFSDVVDIEILFLSVPKRVSDKVVHPSCVSHVGGEAVETIGCEDAFVVGVVEHGCWQRVE